MLSFLIFCWGFEGRGRDSPRRATPFSCSCKKRKQKKHAPAARIPFAGAKGQPAVLGRGAVPRNSLRATRCVQTDAASQITKRVCPSAHAPAPRPALLGTARRGLKMTRAIAALGPQHAGAARRARQAERSDGPCRLHPLSGCASPQVCPVAQRRGAQTAGRVSLGTFLPRSKKVPRPPGRVPASPLKPPAKDQKRELPAQARQGDPPDFPIKSNYRTIHRISLSKAAP